MQVYQDKSGFTLTKDDFKIEWYSGSGAGGQHRNKHVNCCRISHEESGVVARGTEERSQEKNKTTAFKRLANHPKFKAWLGMKLSEIESGKTIEDKVDELMKPENLRVEILDEGRWLASDPSDQDLQD